MPTINDLDITKPDGATEAVAVLDNYIREAKEALKTTFAIEHSLLGAHKFLSGDTASRPAASVAGRLYINTQLKTIQLDDGTAWADLIHYYQRTKVGSYTGDGTSNKGITGLGFTPTFLLVIPLTGTNPSFMKTTAFAGSSSHKLSDNTTSTTGIDTLDADGFTIDADANVNTVVYQYFASRDVP